MPDSDAPAPDDPVAALCTSSAAVLSRADTVSGPPCLLRVRRGDVRAADEHLLSARVHIFELRHVQDA